MYTLLISFFVLRHSPPPESQEWIKMELLTVGYKKELHTHFVVQIICDVPTCEDR